MLASVNSNFYTKNSEEKKRTVQSDVRILYMHKYKLSASSNHGFKTSFGYKKIKRSPPHIKH